MDLLYNQLYFNTFSFSASKSAFGEVLGEKYMRAPAPYSEVAKRQPLILNKSFYYFKKYKPELALQDGIAEVLIEDYKKYLPLNGFLFAGLDESGITSDSI